MSAVRKMDYYYETANQVELDFYKSFGDGDLSLMDSLMANDGVCYTHAGEEAVIGRENVINYWGLILDGIPKATVRRQLLNVTQGDDVEIHLVLESHTCNEENTKVSYTYTTNIYVQQDDGWRLQMQHASLPSKRP